MKTVSIPLVLIALASGAIANTAPTAVIQSAAIRKLFPLRQTPEEGGFLAATQHGAHRALLMKR